jgi:hypothetical protein
MFSRRGPNHLPDIFVLKRELLEVRRVFALEREVLKVIIRRDEPILGETTWSHSRTSTTMAFVS